MFLKDRNMLLLQKHDEMVLIYLRAASVCYNIIFDLIAQD